MVLFLSYTRTRSYDILLLLFLQSPLDVTNHSVAREVVTFFTLPPGDYIVVPQTNVPNCDGKFLLRILTDEQSNIWQVSRFLSNGNV